MIDLRNWGFPVAAAFRDRRVTAGGYSVGQFLAQTASGIAAGLDEQRAGFTVESPTPCHSRATILMNHLRADQPHKKYEPSEQMLTDYIIVGPKLERCFRTCDPWVTVIQSMFLTSFGLIALALSIVIYRALELPSLPYLWQLIMSLCE